MGLLDGFERLINEHGSAVILKERIALANDKYAALEKKLSESKKRCEGLVAENERLAARVAEFEAARSTGNAAKLELEADTERALMAVSKGQSLFAGEVAQQLGIGEQLARHHLEVLSEADLLNQSLTMSPAARNAGPRYTLSPAGRKHLAQRGLL